ncbi:hypothetical protein CEXT_121781 [Caerostris extrusa]|uniref:Uncharacterized protein n=1 Tax=Caerostris extrusa TaxID=172846 RepID=A0AAV4QWV6_CAEEX|nr:hypothetical protein CEXT_121781 [Caerostris extrusa]
MHHLLTESSSKVKKGMKFLEIALRDSRLEMLLNFSAYVMTRVSFYSGRGGQCSHIFGTTSTRMSPEIVDFENCSFVTFDVLSNDTLSICLRPLKE